MVPAELLHEGHEGGGEFDEQHLIMAIDCACGISVANFLRMNELSVVDL